MRAALPFTLPLAGAMSGRDPRLAPDVRAKRRLVALLAPILLSAALAGCTTTPPRTPPAAVRAAQGDDQPEPPTPGIKPLTVEQEEQFGG